MPHTVTLRPKILKEKASRRSLASASANAIEDYLNVKLVQAKKKLNAHGMRDDLSATSAQDTRPAA